MIRILQTHDDPNAADAICDEHGSHEMFRLYINGIEIPLCQSCVNALGLQVVPLMSGDGRDIVEYAPPNRTDGKPPAFRLVRTDSPDAQNGE